MSKDISGREALENPGSTYIGPVIPSWPSHFPFAKKALYSSLTFSLVHIWEIANRVYLQ